LWMRDYDITMNYHTCRVPPPLPWVSQRDVRLPSVKGFQV